MRTLIENPALVALVILGVVFLAEGIVRIGRWGR
mgnify:FL=1